MPNTNRILIVEDDRDVLESLFLLFSRAGLSVLTADNGQQALNLLEHGIRPRLILLDLILPKVSGWDVLRYLEQDTNHREIRVIVMTALDEDERERRGGRRQIRADVTMQKPIDFPALLAHAQRLMGDPAP